MSSQTRWNSNLILLIATVVVSAIGIAVVAYVGTFPREYCAVALLATNPIHNLDREPTLLNSRSQFYAQEAQALLSPVVLQPVVEQLHLASVFAGSGPALSSSEALAILTGNIEVQEKRSRPKLAGVTLEDVIESLKGRSLGLIQISVYDRNPKLAADIANTIFVVYRDRRQAQFEDAIAKSLEQFEREPERCRQIVESNRAEVARLRRLHGIVDSDWDAAGVSLAANAGAQETSANQELVAFPYAYVRAKARYLQSCRVLEGAEFRRVTVKSESKCGPMRVVELWERAEPPAEPAPFTLRRLGSRRRPR